MRFVFHIGIDDVIGYGIILICIAFFLICAIIIAFENAKEKFKRWWRKNIKKEGKDDPTGNERLKRHSGKRSDDK